jgi:hypothetical protein
MKDASSSIEISSSMDIRTTAQDGTPAGAGDASSRRVAAVT